MLFTAIHRLCFYDLLRSKIGGFRYSNERLTFSSVSEAFTEIHIVLIATREGDGVGSVLTAVDTCHSGPEGEERGKVRGRVVGD